MRVLHPSKEVPGNLKLASRRSTFFRMPFKRKLSRKRLSTFRVLFVVNGEIRIFLPSRNLTDIPWTVKNALSYDVVKLFTRQFGSLITKIVSDWQRSTCFRILIDYNYVQVRIRIFYIGYLYMRNVFIENELGMWSLIYEGYILNINKLFNFLIINITLYTIFDFMLTMFLSLMCNNLCEHSCSYHNLTWRRRAVCFFLISEDLV